MKRKIPTNETLEVVAFKAMKRSAYITSAEVFDFLKPHKITVGQFCVLESIYKKGSQCRVDIDDDILIPQL